MCDVGGGVAVCQGGAPVDRVEQTGSTTMRAEMDYGQAT